MLEQKHFKDNSEAEKRNPSAELVEPFLEKADQKIVALAKLF